MPIRLVHGMPFTPHTCVSCANRSTEENCVDLDNEIDFGDQAYLCPGCARVIAELLGYVDPKLNRKMEESRDNYKEKLREAKAKIAELDQEIDDVLTGGKALQKVKKRREEVKSNG